MEQEKNATPQETERGCLLTGVLVTLLLGMSTIAIIMGALLCTTTLEGYKFGETLAIFVVSVFAVFAIIGTFKMKKKAAISLLAVLAVSFVFCFWVAFLSGNSPFSGNLTEQQKSGVGWCIITCAYDVLCCVAIGLGLKKMK